MNKLFAALIITLATTTAFAQPVQSTSYNTGVRTKRSSGIALMPAISFGATQFTNLGDFNNQAKADTGFSVNVGALGEIGRGGWVFQTGLMYMQQKAGATATQVSALQSTFTDQRMTVGYLGIPLAIKARANITRGVRLTGRLGAMPAFIVSRSVEQSTSITSSGVGLMQTSPVAGTQKDSSTEGARSFNVFAIAGFGPEFSMSRNSNLRVELGYERMMMPILESQYNSNVGLHSLNLMMSYAIGL